MSIIDRSIVALFYMVPEGIMVIVAGLGLLGITKPRRRLLLTGVALGFLVAVMRSLGPPTGWHIPITVGSASLFMMYGARIAYLTALTGAILAFFLLSIGDQLLLFPLASALGYSIGDLFNNPWLWIGAGWVSSTFLLLASIAVQFGFVLIPAPAIKRDV